MTDDRQSDTGTKSLLEMWLDASSEFWQTSMRLWPDATTGGSDADDSRAGHSTRLQESYEAMFRVMQVLASVMEKPEGIEGAMRGIAAFPEVASKLIKPVWEALFHMQREWMERAGRIGKSTAAYTYEDMDQDVFKVWHEIYEREFRQFLNVPQLGLTRAYQERLSRGADRFHVFQTTMGEFFSLLYLPVEKSFKVLQDQVAHMAEGGELPERSKEYYRLWVKILEGHYMTLFKSPEYNQTLGRILDSLGDYMVARQEILQDAMQALPVPSQKEMDELYREIYLLKKRIKALEKNQEGNGATANEKSD